MRAFAVVVLAGAVYGSNVADAAPGQPAAFGAGAADFTPADLQFPQTSYGGSSARTLTLQLGAPDRYASLYPPSEFRLDGCDTVDPDTQVCTVTADGSGEHVLTVYYEPRYWTNAYVSLYADVFAQADGAYVTYASAYLSGDALGLGEVAFPTVDLGLGQMPPPAYANVAAAADILNEAMLESVEITDSADGVFSFGGDAPCLVAPAPAPPTNCTFDPDVGWSSAYVPVTCNLPPSATDVIVTGTLQLTASSGDPFTQTITCRGSHVQFETTPAAPVQRTACEAEPVAIELSLEVFGDLPLLSNAPPVLGGEAAADYMLTLSDGGQSAYPGEPLRGELRLRDDAPPGTYPTTVTLSPTNAPPIIFDVTTTVVAGGLHTLVDEIDFGEVAIDQTRAGQVSIKVCVAEGVTIDAIDAPLGFDAGTTSLTVDHQGIATVLVLFHPTDVQAYEGDLTIDTSAGTVVVPLRGVGVGDVENTEPESYYGCGDVGAGGASALPLVVIGLALARRRRRRAGR